MCLLEWLRLKKCPILRIVCRCSPTASKCWCACIVSVSAGVPRASLKFFSFTNLTFLSVWLSVTNAAYNHFFRFSVHHVEHLVAASRMYSFRFILSRSKTSGYCNWLDRDSSVPESPLNTKLLDLWVSINSAQSSFHPLVDSNIPW